MAPSTQAAACPAPSTDYGTVTSTISVPATGSYRTWSRIMAPDTTNNSYSLEVDGANCYVVGDSSSIPVNSWTWINYQNGDSSSPIDISLSAGSHTIKMIGREPNVKLDRVIFVQDTSCVPSGTGDNCTADTTPPATNITTPSNGATVSGTTTVAANASDDIGVTKVEFYIDGSLTNTDTSSPYTFSWDTTTASNGSHNLTTKAYDAAGNITTSSTVTVTVNNSKPSGGAITQDAIVSADQTTAGNTIAVNGLTTTGTNELLEAFISTDGPSGGGATISSVSGGGLTWVLRQRSNTQPGAVEIWQAVAPNALTNVTVTATRGSGQSYVGSITVAAFSGADTSTNGATGTGNGNNSASTVSLTTQAAGSWIWGVGNDYNSATARVVGSAQTKVHEYLASVGDTYWVQRQNAATTNAGTAVALNDVTPSNAQWNMASIEIRPAGSSDTTPPTTSITAPAANANLSGTTTVTANASDNVGVTRVELYIDGSLGATDTAAPYSFSWDTTASTNGSHTLTTKAYDAAGNVTTSSGVTVSLDNTPPATSITAPTAGVSKAGTVTINASASDNVGVTKVEFYDGSTILATDTTSPYSFSWNTAGASNGSHTITTKAYDAAGNITTSSGVTFTVDNSAPTTSLTAPTNGATVNGTVNITANASDNTAVTKVEFYRGSTLLGFDTTSPYSYSWDTTALANGSYTLTAKAYDAAGNVTTSSAATVTVNNVVAPPPDTTPPTVSIASPSGGATVSGSETVDVNASDNVGVTKVEFYVDGSLKGAADMTAPYSFSWDTTTASNASHSLTTKAYDAAGNVTTSSAVTVTVNNAPPPVAGDVNGDGHVTLIDMAILLTNYGRSGMTRSQGELSGDGTVNLLDLAILLTNYGT